MAAFEVRMDRSRGQLRYRNAATNIVHYKTPSALSGSRQTATPAKRWLDEEEEEWEEGDEEWAEEQYEEPAYRLAPAPRAPPPYPLLAYRPTPSTALVVPPLPAPRPRAGPGPDVIARVAARLPPGWECRFDRVTGRVYYAHHATKKTTFDPPPLLPPREAKPDPAGAMMGELVRLKAQQKAIAARMRELQRRLEAPDEPPKYHAGYDDPPRLTGPPVAKTPVAKATKKKAKKAKKNRVVLPWEAADAQPFVESMGIAPEGTFERFCRRQLRDLPGVQLDDCQAHWLVLPPEEQSMLMKQQEKVQQLARKQFDAKMKGTGVTDIQTLRERWAALPWRERQDFYEDAELELDEDPEATLQA